MQENTTSPENTKLTFPNALKKKRILFHSTDQSTVYSEDLFHTDPCISHQLEIRIL